MVCFDFERKAMIMPTSLNNLKNAVIELKKTEVVELLPLVLNTYKPADIFSKAIYPALDNVRNRFNDRMIGMPELLLSLSLVGIILQKISTDSYLSERSEHILIGVVEGDTHDMGKNIVRDIYKGYGFKVTDLGKNVSTKTFLQNARQIQPAVIGISTMMSTTVDKVGTLIEMMKKELPQSRIMVGGAFINSKIARSLSADGYAENAATLIEETEAVLSIAP